MGQVFLAHDRLLDRPVAIKFANIHVDDQAARERFLVEARAAARIQHPNVISIFRIGELDGHPYLVTEFLRGQSLGTLKLPQPSSEVLKILIDLARGLATAHRQGVLHRDIKLDNAFLCEDGTAKLLDFGLAKLEHSPQPPAADPLEDTTTLSRQPLRSKPSSDLLQVLPSASEPMVEDEESIALEHSTDDTLEPVALPGEPPPEEVLHGEWKRTKNRLTQPGTLVGTPHYMAPELWRGQPASRSSDIYALGVLMRILLSGSPPFAALTPYELMVATEDETIEPTANLVPGLHPDLAAIVDRCLAFDVNQRFATGDELRTALEAISQPDAPTTKFTGNPYRGLRAFEAEHRSLFFGRTIETRTLVDRLRADPFILVAGDSGVGKSSLCRAGVSPHILEGTLDRDRDWQVINLIPGRRPLQSLIAILAHSLDFHEASLSSLIDTKLDSVGWFIRKKLGNNQGRLLLIDQLEEMVTIADPEEARLAGAVLAQFAIGVPGMRTMATVRGDFLTRVAQIPSLGDELMRAIYILRPLSADALREAITGPAATQGVSYEPDVVDELVDAGRQGSLPLLQFALAELWEIHNTKERPIGRDDLKRIGGVTGALARHADGVLSAMLPVQRKAARHLLSRLVTIENTRASLTADELTAGDTDMQASLEALVRGRILVIRETDSDPVFEIAHEALIHGWGTLTRWLEAEQEKRSARHQLETTAAEWARRGQPKDLLYSPSQLTTAQLLERTKLRQVERDFLDRSQSQARRTRLLRRLAIAAVPLIVVGTYVSVQIQNYRTTQNQINAKLAESATKLLQAKNALTEIDAMRLQAYDAFDAGKYDEGKQQWQTTEEHESQVDAILRQLGQELEAVLSLDPTREQSRGLLADTLYTRAWFAEQRYQDTQKKELLARMSLYDFDGSRQRQWQAPGTLALATNPPNVAYAIERYTTNNAGRTTLEPTEINGRTPIVDLSLPPGSYRVRLDQGDDNSIFLPIALTRKQQLKVELELPNPAAIPAGYTYIPGGRFLFGSSDRKLWNFFYNTVPIHPRVAEPFFIATHETTYRDWIEFLESMPLQQRGKHLPGGTSDLLAGSRLTQLPTGEWEFQLQAGDKNYRVTGDELLRYEGRKQRIEQDWRNLPVTNISYASAQAYAAWLDQSGRLPGARICTELEWERAARGADSRLYPHGFAVEPDDFNFDETYAKKPTAQGPDAVGSYPISASPFGVQDMAGNVWEWVSPVFGGDDGIARGGAYFYDRISGTTVNRALLPPDAQDTSVGLRTCTKKHVQLNM